jgi:hypothetical protein
MKPILAAKQTLSVGIPILIESDTPDNARGVVFEDDGETGYFYARDYTVKSQLWVDALHIYTVEGVKDRDMLSEVCILWSANYTKAALLINKYPHAVFDFIRKCGYSRDQFPDPDPQTGWTHKLWDDSLREYFFD